jgi:hypothetical protein
MKAVKTYTRYNNSMLKHGRIITKELIDFDMNSLKKVF